MSTVVESVPLSPLLVPSREESLYEVVNGQILELAEMGVTATLVASALHLFLGPFVRDRRLGRAVVEGLFILDETVDLRRRPDNAFVSAQRWPLDRPVPDTGDWPTVPDLAIEVISPNDRFEAVLGKVLEYFRHGVGQIWLVTPAERQLWVFDSPTRVRIFAAGDVVTDTIVPGFTLKLADLFQQAQ
jgi:Uma2 family endonuclease